MTYIDPLDALRWYADDFETTTDLDGSPTPYELGGEEIESLSNLPIGETRMAVLRRPLTEDTYETYTVTATRQADGCLTAVQRTGRVRVWSWAIAPLDSEQVFTGTTIQEY